MSEGIRAWILRWLRIPAAPHPPDGAPGSLQVFRAAPNFYRLLVLGWAARQVAALVGLVFALVFAHRFVMPNVMPKVPFRAVLEGLVAIAEVGGVVAFFAQLPLSFLIVRLDYELRWYLMTDRSLRIRSGIWTVEELTMTFANIQELTVRQGPLQRLLGIADLRVRSAGGGGTRREGEERRETHVGYFHGVDNAPALRDLIQAQLRQSRDAGLGDPDEAGTEAAGGAPTAGALAAAREVLAEAAAMRRSLPSCRPRAARGLPGDRGSEVPR